MDAVPVKRHDVGQAAAGGTIRGVTQGAAVRPPRDRAGYARQGLDPRTFLKLLYRNVGIPFAAG